jgi:ribosomal-protein-alanine N-acetyltransferase
MILIRKFKPSDLSRVYGIECKSFKDPYDVFFLLNLYELYPESFLVAEKSGMVVGYVIARLIGRKGHIIAIAVAPEYRRRGIGRALMRSVTQVLKSQGAEELFLEVRASNRAAIRFYEKQGFKQVQLIPKYYADGEDGVLLRKSPP